MDWICPLVFALISFGSESILLMSVASFDCLYIVTHSTYIYQNKVYVTLVLTSLASCPPKPENFLCSRLCLSPKFK